ncbi:plasmid pRiA4b ORF-3 family protein [Arthrobacter sp. H35-D1]|uniref:plasmid pRiA4b ORF-3 family protein n=1 Tax=Arthrobacter sp. H35-D1 TaxID=3046202 RepID=UPI0024BBD3EA|nr:plasmid pRiA4b ORF-3 family protein [Arthrobacter sp. H35-D1]MDJ0312689.1 plasmid pRiA4b ORF-3 family protein [Arthrobacter sp. H35-D1]
MAKKTTRTGKAQNRGTSVSALRAERATSSVTKDFVDWCVKEHDFPAETGLALLEPVATLAAAYFESTPSSDVTSFEPVPFRLAFAQLMAGVDGQDEDELDFIFESVHLYIEFLAETGAWTGPEEHLLAVHSLFHGESEEGGIPQIIAPELTPAQELEGLAGTELARRMEALLGWLGAGKDVTSTGALRLKDIEGAAAAIGVRVKGVKPSDKYLPEVLFGGGQVPGDAVRSVKSMHEEPKLALFWTALEVAQLIDVGATRAWPTPWTEAFLEQPELEGREVLRAFATAFVAVSMQPGELWDPAVIEAASVKTAILVAATTDTPPQMESIHTMLTVGVGPVEDEHTGTLVLEDLAYFAELGLITVGTQVEVPPALVICMADALAETMDGMEGGKDDDEDFDPFGVSPASASTLKPNPKAPILQLKVSIKRSSPPVWRRLLVRTDLSLGQLHHIIQASFEWLDYHLHEFRVGGYPGTVYGVVGEANHFDDPPLDEAGTAIGELLATERDTVAYTYDFGDDWEHGITVEKVLPADANAPAVRCTGGRGRGPVEDCGGVWGWSTVVEAVNDPAHEEHEEYRDWLGMVPGEHLDPKEFNKDELNEDLTYLF